MPFPLRWFATFARNRLVARRQLLKAGALAMMLGGAGCPEATSLGRESDEPRDDAPASGVDDASAGGAEDAATYADASAPADAGDRESDAADGGADAAPDVTCACEHGSCDGVGACVCDPGYTGTLCDVAAFAGSGRDGALIVGADTNLGVFNHEGRSCADGGDAVAYVVLEVTGPRELRLHPAPAPGCLNPGDEVLLVNQQGTATSTRNTGEHEFLEVAEVSADRVRFTADKRGHYGASEGGDDGFGTHRASQRVMLQRVPHYTEVVVTAGTRLTTSGWGGVRGGVLALRASERIVVAGTIDMAGRGYMGGARTPTASTSGQVGESIAGPSARGQVQNAGGGGGGAGDGQCEGQGASGGGGGHGSDGSPGSRTCSGREGLAYGSLERWTLGAGGGAGGQDDNVENNPPGGQGGAGGGIVALFTRELFVFGEVDASGSAGEGDLTDDGSCDALSTVSCWDFAGPGGGGAGGLVWLEVEALTAAENAVLAVGGAGGNGGSAGNGGRGGDGRVVVTSYDVPPAALTVPPATVRAP